MIEKILFFTTLILGFTISGGMAAGQGMLTTLYCPTNDTIPPQFTALSGVTPSPVGKDGLITIIAYVADNCSVQSVFATIKGPFISYQPQSIKMVLASGIQKNGSWAGTFTFPSEDKAQDGQYSLQINAIDTNGQAENRITSVVLDRTDPVLQVQESMTIKAESSSGAIVSFDVNVIAKDNGLIIQHVCEPPSGSLFSITTTIVRCSAKDLAGNSVTKEFQVIVYEQLLPELTPKITVQTDKQSYRIGDKITISGTVKGIFEGQNDVAIQITGPDSKQAILDSGVIVNGEYSVRKIISAGAFSIDGSYTVKASYNNAHAKSTFQIESQLMTLDRPPVAENDTARYEKGKLRIDVLKNDYDDPGDKITVVFVSNPEHGNAINNGDGSVTYVPDTNFEGKDTFTYTITDILGEKSVASVTVIVPPKTPEETKLPEETKPPEEPPLKLELVLAAVSAVVAGTVVTLMNVPKPLPHVNIPNDPIGLQVLLKSGVEVGR